MCLQRACKLAGPPPQDAALCTPSTGLSWFPAPLPGCSSLPGGGTKRHLSSSTLPGHLLLPHCAPNPSPDPASQPWYRPTHGNVPPASPWVSAFATAPLGLPAHWGPGLAHPYDMVGILTEVSLCEAPGAPGGGSIGFPLGLGWILPLEQCRVLGKARTLKLGRSEF